MNHEELIGLLDYDTGTGLFVWKSGWKKGKAAGWIKKDGYAYVCIRYTTYLAHRIAWFYVHGEFPADQIDHINGVRSDNRIANLRPVSRTENAHNQRRAQASSHTKILGVGRSGTRYRARIRVNRKYIHLGCFGTAEEAYEAYLEAKRTFHAGNTL